METPVLLSADADIAVCVKPVGCECEHELPALLAAALGGNAASFRCIHRLDRTVGGVMVFARTQNAAAHLSRQVQLRTLEKEYLAVCSGAPTPREGEMQDWLFKDSARQKSFAVRAPRGGVKEARLAYRVLETQETGGAPCSLVRVALHTGRFHQIRCQFASRGHPLLGDGKYGSRVRGCTVALWSVRLAFTHPASGKRIALEALPPSIFPWNSFAALRS